MDNKVVIGVISAFVVVTMLAMVLMPVIDMNTQGERTVQEGAGWLRMEYTASGASYSIAADAISSDDGLLVYNGTDSQIGADDTIIYASSNLTAWMQDGVLEILGTNDDGVFYAAPEESFIITRDASGVSLVVDDGETPYTFSSPTWAYVPKSTGNYGFFENGTAVQIEDGKPIVAAGGGNVGVYAVSNMFRYDGLGLQLQTTIDENGKLTGAYWAKPAAADDQRSVRDRIDIIPLDPGDTRIGTDPEPDVVRYVPTPTYTEGDWGYNLMQVDGVDKAVIVSYSGAGGDVITVPATIGGYDVYQFGLDSNNATVFNTSLAATDLVISYGPTIIGRDALKGCTGFTGSIIIPGSVTSIGNYAFYGSSGFTGSILVPGNVTTIGEYAFSYCSAMNGVVVIPDSVTTISPNAFSNTNKVKTLIVSSDAIPGTNSLKMTGITEVLDLSEDIDYSTDGATYGIPATATVETTIGDAIGYVSFTEIGTDAPLSGSAATLLLVIPVIIIASMLVAAVGWFIYNRY